MSLPIFPELPTMAWNSQKYERWDTVIKKSGKGKRKTLSRRAYPEWEIRCSYTCLDTAAIKKAAGFFGMVRGAFQEFLWKDPEDYREENVRIGTGDGINREFQLIRNFGELYVEPVTDIVVGSLTVYVNGVQVGAVVGDDGLVTLTVAPTLGAVITATYEYYWRVAFKDDDMSWDNFWYGYYKLNTISVVTV